MNSLVAKILRNGLAADFPDRDRLQKIGLKFESPKIGREKNLAAGIQMFERQFQQFHVVALHVPIERGLLALGKCRRIENRQIERRLMAAGVISQKLSGVVPHELVLRSR